MVFVCRIVRCRSHHLVWPVAAGMARRRIACGRARRVPYRPVPDRVRYRPSLGAGSRAVRSVARSRLVLFLPVSVTSESLPWSWSGERNVRRRPCPGPTAACSRRRPQRFTNIYSYVWPWCFSVAPSAARLRRIVGPLASRTAVAGQTRQRDIIGHNRA